MLRIITHYITNIIIYIYYILQIAWSKPKSYESYTRKKYILLTRMSNIMYLAKTHGNQRTLLQMLTMLQKNLLILYTGLGFFR